MTITDIKIRKTFNEGNGRIFAAMPNRLDSNDVYRDIVHPISAEARHKLESIILKAYENYTELFGQPQA